MFYNHINECVVVVKYLLWRNDQKKVVGPNKLGNIVVDNFFFLKLSIQQNGVDEYPNQTQVPLLVEQLGDEYAKLMMHSCVAVQL